VVTAETQRCTVGRPITLRARQAGYLSSSVTTETGRGAADCPWRLTVDRGQRINLTLINFARVGLPSADWSQTQYTAALRTRRLVSDGSCVARHPTAGLRRRRRGPSATAQDLLPAGQSARAPLHPAADRVRGRDVKAAEPIEMPLGGETRVGARKLASGGGRSRPATGKRNP